MRLSVCINVAHIREWRDLLAVCNTSTGIHAQSSRRWRHNKPRKHLTDRVCYTVQYFLHYTKTVKDFEVNLSGTKWQQEVLLKKTIKWSSINTSTAKNTLCDSILDEKFIDWHVFPFTMSHIWIYWRVFLVSFLFFLIRYSLMWKEKLVKLNGSWKTSMTSAAKNPGGLLSVNGWNLEPVHWSDLHIFGYI